MSSSSTPERGALSDSAIAGLVAASAGNARALAGLASQLLARGHRATAIDLAWQAHDLAPDDGLVHELTARTLGHGVPAWHFDLVRDHTRNQAYDGALRRACGPDTRVLDIGAGTGLLAMMAARAGAGHVVTCEMNPPVASAAARIVALNGFADRVRVVPKPSSDLGEADLDGRVDVIVSEIVSNNLLGEAALPAMQDAVARLLKPGGRVIPSAGEIRIALAHHDSPISWSMRDADGFDVRPFNRLAPACTRVPVGNKHLFLRSEPETLFAFDFQSGGPYPDRETTVVLASTGGVVSGIVQWIRLYLDESGVYENRPAPGTSSAWAAMFHPLPRAVDTQPGTTVTVHASHALTSVRLWTDPAD